MKNVRRGDIFFADLDPTIGREIKKTRPVLIISNDINNSYSDLVTIAPITSQTEKIYPYEVLISTDESGLDRNSKIMCNQIRTIDKARLTGKTGAISKSKISQVEKAVCVHLDINLS